MIEEKATKELDQMLEDLGPNQVEQFFKENKSFMKQNNRDFYNYMTDVLAKKKIKLKDVYSFAGESDSYGSKIMKMEKHTTNRDVIIRFCIAGHFTWDETNRALKLYGFNELYSKDKRDICILIAIKNRIYDLAKIDDMLTKQGLEKISKDEKSINE